MRRRGRRIVGRRTAYRAALDRPRRGGHHHRPEAGPRARRAGTDQHGRRRHRRQRRPRRGRARRRRRGGGRRHPGPRARDLGLPAGGPAPAARPSPRPAARRSTASRPGVRRGLAVVGFPEWDGDCHNSAAVVADGRVQAVYRKRFLPNYGVFDEARYFRAGRRPDGDRGARRAHRPRRVRGHLVPEPGRGRPRGGARRPRSAASRPRPTTGARATGASRCWRRAPTTAPPRSPSATRSAAQDELVFDGRSALFDAVGRAGGARAAVRGAPAGGRRRPRRCRRAAACASRSRGACPTPPNGEVDPDRGDPRRAATARRPPTAARSPRPCATSPRCGPRCAPGLRDYVDKNRFPGVILGLSGGIDSALTAALAADALGPERVTGVALPSRSLLAREPGRRAGARRVAGDPPDRAADRGRSSPPSRRSWPSRFAGREPDITEENLQARARGTLLMALSNKLGLLVLATGNKSEMSVGYSTLYGDMVGGLRAAARPLQDLGLPPGPLAQRVGGARGDPRGDDRAAADRGAATRPARHGQPSAL